MRRLKSHFDVFKISLVHIVTAWQPECQKLPKYQVLFFTAPEFSFFPSSRTTAFGRACPYRGFQENPLAPLGSRWSCGIRAAGAVLGQPGWRGSIFQHSEETRCKSTIRRPRCSSRHLLLPATGNADPSVSRKPALLICSPPPTPQSHLHHVAHPAGSFPGTTRRWEGRRRSASLPVGW